MAESAHAPDKEQQAIDAVEELIAEFGLRATVSACLKSTGGDAFNKLGGNTSLRIVQVIIREIVYSKNPQLEAEVMALGAGILMGDEQSITSVARKHGISKAAVSKRVVAFCDENGLPPSPFMKSKKARETYALTNRPRT